MPAFDFFNYHTPWYRFQFDGKNPDFVAFWDCRRQVYDVYYKKKLLVGNKYKFSQIQSYLN